MSYVKQGTAAFRKTNLALFAGGFNTFAIMYCTQPLLPEFSKVFHVSPSVASLSLSLTTVTLAVSMLLAGSLSEVLGRKPIMAFSLFTVSFLTIFTAVSPNYQTLLVFRILQGLVLSGLPAIAMAYLGEEIEPASLGTAMGLYISGNTIGGMSGRIITGMLTDFYNWHIAVVVIGILGIVSSVVFWVTLPRSKHFRPRSPDIGKLARSLFSQFKEPGLLCLYVMGFLLMGSFVTLYNYIGYQLIAPPYSLNQTLVSSIFIVYICGTFGSAWMGRLGDKFGRSKVLLGGLLTFMVGALITLDHSLWIKTIGIALFTFGFFGTHAIASSWVGRLATHDKAQASSLYLFFYYFGSSIGGTAGGVFWSNFGWAGVIGMILFLLVFALLLSIRLIGIGNAKKEIGSLQPSNPMGYSR